MGMCSSKKQSQPNLPENIPQEQCSIQDGSFSRQPQLKSSLVQTPNFHQNTGSLHQSSKILQSQQLQQVSEKKIKQEFQSEYTIIRQLQDCLLIQQRESGNMCKAFVYSKSSQDSEQLITRLLSMPLLHDQIIKLIDIYNDGQNYFVVYEYSETVAVVNYMKEHKNNQEKAGEVFNQMTNIVAYLHEQQYSHGSLSIDSFEMEQDKVILTQTKSIYLKLPTKLTQKNDVQSLGLIGFHLLIGHQFRLMVNKSSKWEIKKELAEEFKNSSPNIQKLLLKMIDPIPLHRISIQQVQQLRWVREEALEPAPKVNCQKLTSLAALFIYYTIEKFLTNDKEILTQQFMLADEDQDGKLPFQDFLALYSQQKKCQKKLYELIEDEGEITLQVFLIVAIDQEKLLNDKIVSASYMSLCNKSGYITPKSVAKKLQVDELQLTDMFSEFTEYDRLNLLEFKQILQEG